MKKNILKLLTLSIVSIFVASCNNNSNTSSETNSQTSEEVKEEITLKFWHGFTGTDGDHMASMVDKFNEEYKGKINVEVNRLNWDTLFTKFYQQKNNPKFSPNIIAVPANRLGSVISRNMITTMDDIMDTFNLSESDFLPAAYEIGNVNNHRYSFPLDMHPTAIFYNK